MWRKGKGFTLIELMVVIAIILILALIAIPAYRNMQLRAKKSKAQSDMRTLATVLQAYYTDWTEFPTTLNSLLGNVDTAGGTNSGTSATGEQGPIKYLDVLPKDVFAPNADYNYKTDSETDPQSWVLYTATYSENGNTYVQFRDSVGNAGATTGTPTPP